MKSSPNRLERALELFVAHELRGGDWNELVAANADLADVLASLRPLEEGDGVAAEVGGEEHDLVREIGHGGLGVVYEARDRKLGRRLAVKMLHAHCAEDPMTLARFRREALLLARLDHAHIVRVLGAGEAGGRPWLGMEFVDGEPLSAFLDRQRIAGGHAGGSLVRIVRAIAQIADALQHAHSMGVVHRDLKPSNILLRRNGDAVLTDFGIARNCDEPALTHSGGMVGTPYYMSPEQVSGLDADARSDVFSLGATLYTALTFERPFPGETSEAVLRRIVTTEPTDPRRFHRSLPADLVAIVYQALNKEPRQRYQNAAEFASDLEAFLDHRPVRARRIGPVARLVRTLRRRPLLAAAFFVVVLGVPAIAGMTGFLLARLPQIEAGQQQQLADLIESGWTYLASNHRYHPDARAVMDRWLAIAPQDPEAIILNAMVIDRWEGGPSAALAWLRSHPDQLTESVAMRRTQALLVLIGGDRNAAAELAARLPAPAGYLDVYVASVLEQGKAQGDDPRAGVRAIELSELASRLTPRPRLGFYLCWAANLVLAGDADGRRRCIAALNALWPESSRAWSAVADLYSVDQPQKAIEACERVLEFLPGEPGVLRQIAELRARVGASGARASETHR